MFGWVHSKPTSFVDAPSVLLTSETLTPVNGSAISLLFLLVSNSYIVPSSLHETISSIMAVSINPFLFSYQYIFVVPSAIA